MMLKEVAKVFTRELELWTDTLHLRVRNKIQESIVEFSKFCLEIQLANNSSNNDENKIVKSTIGDPIMKQYFNMAVKLMRDTLNVDSVYLLEMALSFKTADPQRQFEEEERDYLSNFGINIVNEVIKRKVIIADRAKGAFVSSISHELRNPLQRSN
ncbi:hypothetical protein RhiirA5_421431 [Rhizophagus irregularis]|uniref:Signal transduction histidine kinase dimerisation/phosphoacceptor domain-containing protein n=1 Tax=Rhizophagus irregularis TaxID=588596 RepID=A0A2N0PDZ9_9GLOM|nr:hypothetical protein RhiirA5_421431 [Rhizophagus irregularis]